MGLVHEVVPAAAVTAAAARAVETLLLLPDGARAATKLNLREAFSREWEGFIEEEARAGWEMLREPDVERALGGVLERLSSSSRRREGSGGGAETPTAKL